MYATWRNFKEASAQGSKAAPFDWPLPAWAMRGGGDNVRGDLMLFATPGGKPNNLFLRRQALTIEPGTGIIPMGARSASFFENP